MRMHKLSYFIMCSISDLQLCITLCVWSVSYVLSFAWCLLVHCFTRFYIGSFFSYLFFYFHSVLFIVHFFICFLFFFFKQKTAYEMRISDWSSDVCSSD